MHPGVLVCAAVGVPDDRSGEAVRLFVVRKDPALTEQDVVKYCRDNLTGYKVPRHVEFRDSLPKSPVGNIQRRELREAAAVRGAGSNDGRQAAAAALSSGFTRFS